MRTILAAILLSGCLAQAATYNDTQYVQDLLDTQDLVILSEDLAPYRIDTLYLKHNQELRCIGQYRVCLKGLGTGPVLKTVGRHITIKDINIENTGYPAIEIENSPNIIIENARLKTDVNSLSIRYSWRVTIRDSFITTDGPNWAIHAIDNINGLTIEDNIVSGRMLGGAINVGHSASVNIEKNIIETSKNGISVCGNVEPGSGRCDAVNISNNYIENSSTPIVIGTAHKVWSGVVINNFISNLAADFERSYSINLGFVNNLRVCNNNISARADEIPITPNNGAVICDNYIR